MSAARLIKYVHLAYFAKPVANRAVFRAIHKSRPSTIVAIGLGDGQLAHKSVLVAQELSGQTPIRFTGIDLFEMRGAEEGGSKASGLTLKQAHRLLHWEDVRTQLVPGDPFTALARTANALTGTDLILVRADQLGAAMDQAWFYVPRMLHEGSLVLVEQVASDGQPTGYDVLDRVSIQRLAAAHTPNRRAAA